MYCGNVRSSDSTALFLPLMFQKQNPINRCPEAHLLLEKQKRH
jgi:hypothetical protein